MIRQQSVRIVSTGATYGAFSAKQGWSTSLYTKPVPSDTKKFFHNFPSFNVMSTISTIDMDHNKDNSVHRIM